MPRRKKNGIDQPPQTETASDDRLHNRIAGISGDRLRSYITSLGYARSAKVLTGTVLARPLRMGPYARTTKSNFVNT